MATCRHQWWRANGRKFSPGVSVLIIGGAAGTLWVILIWLAVHL